jgi:hypothetical protein
MTMMMVVVVIVVVVSTTPVLAYAQFSVSGTISNTTTTAEATATNSSSLSANGLSVITNMTWYGSVLNTNQTAFTNATDVVEPLSAENIEYHKTDAVFAKLTQDTYACIQHDNELTKERIQQQQGGNEIPLLPPEEDINRQDQCTDTIRLGVEAVCDSSTFTEATDFTYDYVEKCQEAARMTNAYVINAEVLYD